MKILVLTITAGEGHNSTASAIKDGIDTIGGESVDCKIVDVYKLLNSMLYNAVSKGYLFATKRLKKLYGDIYALMENRKYSADDDSPMRKVNYGLAKTLEKYVSMYDPDAIVYTHVLAGILLDDIKVRYGLRAKTIGIVTDFRLHPYWEEVTHLDYVVCADKRMTYSVCKKGFSKEKILPFGIPIHPKFTVEIPKETARAKLGLDNRLTLLVMGGSMGFGNMVENVKTLDALDIDYQIVVICGNNKDAYAQLSELETTKKMYVFGFVNNVELFMSAADLIVSKPGGLTSSEALAKRLPMVIVNPIPGQEDRNVEFLLNNGAAVATSKTLKLDEAVWMCLHDTTHLESIVDAIDKIRHPDSTRKICEFAVKLAKENLSDDAKID